MLRSMFSLFLFAATVFAQNAYIGLPTANQAVTAGSELIVQVQQPDSLTGYEEVAVVIGLQSCPDSPCFPPSEVMGTILYNGPFDPQFYGPSAPYQNFTVQIPSSVATGTASISVMHVEIVGASSEPLYELLNQTITIVS